MAALGISLNYTMFLCIRNNSALTSVMVGHLKTMLQVSFFSMHIFFPCVYATIPR